MTVNFTTATSSQRYVPTVTVANASKLPANTNVIKADSLEHTDVKEKKSLFSKVSTFWGSVKKAFASAGEYTKGFFKGVGGAALTGSLVFTGTTMRQAIKKRPKNTAGVVASVVVAAGTFVYNMYKAYLNANEAKANIDHRYR